LGILNNRRLRTLTSTTQKQAVLNQYIKYNPGYDSIAVTDIGGNVILQSAGEVIDNYSQIDYFQEVIRTNRPVISPPRKSSLTGEYSIFFAAPVVDTATGKTIGMVRSRIPLKYFNKILQAEAKELTQNIKGFASEEYLVINDIGKVVVAPTQHIEYIGKDANTVFPQAAARLQTANTVGTVVDFEQLEQEKYLVSYMPVGQLQGLAESNWSAMIAQSTAEVFAARRGLLLTFAIGTAVAGLLVSAIAAFLVNRALRPLVGASAAVRKLGQGRLDTRIPVQGKDELAVLGSNINQMADQLQTLLREQENLAERAQTFTDVTLRIRRSLNLEDILKTSVKEVRKVLETDRVVIYNFNTDLSGTIVAESVAPGWTQALAETIDDPCFKERHIKLYKDGRVRAIDNIHQAGLTDCHIKTLERFEVKANLVAPILKDNQLLGLLIAHHCSETRAWQQSEIDLFTQLATQIGFAIDQANLLEQVEKARRKAEAISQQQRQQKEALQHQLMELLNDVEAAARGNLTVRAEVTAGEIGTVADFFNAIIESLGQLVTQVKKTAAQVNVSVGENAGAVRHLADEALNQAEEINHTLGSVERMAVSIQEVADSAYQAAVVARTASTTAQTRGAAMDRTVESILNLRETIAQTANKVKRLGESSQQISKVVSLIHQIALQTNVLAINASIEATRAGEEGRGFAVVAEEVGGLAAKSAAATKEIEQIVENIQRETSEVVRAMELGTTQVVEGTYFVEDTKKSLEQILDVSREIDVLVQSISSATVSQAQTSQAVTHLMQEIAKVSERTSDSSRQVSSSLQQTVAVAQQLQASVGAFKVDSKS
jgi:twitching motility protein PilJ